MSSVSLEDLEGKEFVSHDHSYANKLISERGYFAQCRCEEEFPPKSNNRDNKLLQTRSMEIFRLESNKGESELRQTSSKEIPKKSKPENQANART